MVNLIREETEKFAGCVPRKHHLVCHTPDKPYRLDVCVHVCDVIVFLYLLAQLLPPLFINDMKECRISSSRLAVAKLVKCRLLKL